MSNNNRKAEMDEGRLYVWCDECDAEPDPCADCETAASRLWAIAMRHADWSVAMAQAKSVLEGKQ